MSIPTPRGEAACRCRRSRCIAGVPARHDVDDICTRDILKPDACSLESIASQEISGRGNLGFMQLGGRVFQSASLPERGLIRRAFSKSPV